MIRLTITIVGCVLWLVWCGARVYPHITYDQTCGGYLKRAADANTVEMAKEQLQLALTTIEKNNWTEGYTSVFWRTPDEDIGFWYKNLKTSMSELEQLPANATPLEKSNMLMKLRETLLDKGKEGERVTAPDGISIYPHNGVMALFFIISSLLALIGIGAIVLNEF